MTNTHDESSSTAQSRFLGVGGKCRSLLDQFSRIFLWVFQAKNGLLVPLGDWVPLHRSSQGHEAVEDIWWPVSGWPELILSARVWTQSRAEALGLCASELAYPAVPGASWQLTFAECFLYDPKCQLLCKAWHKQLQYIICSLFKLAEVLRKEEQLIKLSVSRSTVRRVFLPFLANCHYIQN